LGIFLLGTFTRRATGPAVLAGAAVGSLTALWLTLGHHLAASSALGWAWPWKNPAGAFWPLPLGLAATLGAGYLLSFLLPGRKSRQELAGLVVGLGPWGAIADNQQEGPEEPTGPDEVYWIESEYDEDEKEDDRREPWR